MSRGWLKGRNVQGKAKTSFDLVDGVRVKVTGWLRFKVHQGTNVQLLKCSGNVYPQLPFSQWEISGEQQMKLSIVDEAYVSNVDTCVVYRGGIPGGCRVSNLQTSSEGGMEEMMRAGVGGEKR